MKLNLLPTCLQCYLPEIFLENGFYLLMSFYYRYICIYRYMPSLVGIVWKTNEILHIVQSVALGVCFSIDIKSTPRSIDKSTPCSIRNCKLYILTHWQVTNDPYTGRHTKVSVSSLSPTPLLPWSFNKHIWQPLFKTKAKYC